MTTPRTLLNRTRACRTTRRGVSVILSEERGSGWVELSAGRKLKVKVDARLEEVVHVFAIDRGFTTPREINFPPFLDAA